VADDDGWQVTASFFKFLLIFFNLGQVCLVQECGPSCHQAYAHRPMTCAYGQFISNLASPQRHVVNTID
jgi:hypothetical protein